MTSEDFDPHIFVEASVDEINLPDLIPELRFEIAQSGSWHGLVMRLDHTEQRVRPVIVEHASSADAAARNEDPVLLVYTRSIFTIRKSRRRISDFQRLDRRIRARFPAFGARPPFDRPAGRRGGPPPPPLEQRVQQLQAYLDGAADDPEVAGNHVLRTFLGFDPSAEPPPSA